jgi:hypothetical protein
VASASEWVNASVSKPSVQLEYVNGRLNLEAPPVDRAAVSLGSITVESSLVVLGVEAGAGSYSIYFAVGLGSLTLTPQVYPITVTLLSSGSPVLFMAEHLSFVSSDDRVFGGDIYTLVLCIREDPVVIWALDNRPEALPHLTLKCAEGEYHLQNLKERGARLEYSGGALTIYNPPPCTNPALRVYVGEYAAQVAEPGRIVFRVSG